MNRRQKIIVSVTGIFMVLLILIGLTYAYFLTRITGNSSPNSISVTTANLELIYGDGTTNILTNETPIEPGKFTSSKDFTVTNNGNVITEYAVTLEDFSIVYATDTVINGQSIKAGTVTKLEYPEDMEMTLVCIKQSDNSSCGIVEGALPTHNDIITTNSIEVGETHKYVLTLTYVDSGIDQSKDMNKTIRGKIDIIDPKSTIDLTGTVASYESGDYVEINSTPIKSEIVNGTYKIIGVEPGNHTLHIKYIDSNGNVQSRGSQSLVIKKGDESNVSGNTIIFTDASREVIVDVTETFNLNISEVIKEKKEAPMLAPCDSWYDFDLLSTNIEWEYDFENDSEYIPLTSITFLDKASEEIINSAELSWPSAVDKDGDEENDSDITSYYDADTDTITIAGNGSGEILANPDSSNMFNLVHLNSNFFLENINNLSLLNTSNVTNMANMFAFNNKIKSLDVSNFDTSKVTNMAGMFHWNENLTSLDISNFNTSKVTNMDSMFMYTTSLTTLDATNFDTSKVTNMYGMFGEMHSIAELDLSNFDTSKVTDMSYMFAFDYNLKTIYVSDKFVITEEAKESEKAFMEDSEIPLFADCTSLVGGNGTVYIGYEEDYDRWANSIEYARIDRPGSPGYFTLKQ